MRMSLWGVAQPPLEEEHFSTSLWLWNTPENIHVRLTMAWVPSTATRWAWRSQVSQLSHGVYKLVSDGVPQTETHWDFDGVTPTRFWWRNRANFSHALPLLRSTEALLVTSHSVMGVIAPFYFYSVSSTSTHTPPSLSKRKAETFQNTRHVYPAITDKATCNRSPYFWIPLLCPGKELLDHSLPWFSSPFSVQYLSLFGPLVTRQSIFKSVY